MKKILVIGCPGAGKSTFARKLRDLTGLPLFYLDRIWHRPDRTTVSPQEFDEALDQILSGETWIIDGNYIRTLKKRLAACDTVFFLDYPVKICLDGVGSRIGTVREDMPWVEEAFDPDFRKWITDFPQDQLPEIYAALKEISPGKKIVVFHSRAESEAWIENEFRGSGYSKGRHGK